MLKFVVLDSSPLALLAIPENRLATAETMALRKWALDCTDANVEFVIPEIVDYEVRRELLRAGKRSSVLELDKLCSQNLYIPLKTAAMKKAAELWADMRRRGRPTAENENIDVDMILAAQVLTCGIPTADVVVATSNLRHLSQLVPAQEWQNIAP